MFRFESSVFKVLASTLTLSLVRESLRTVNFRTENLNAEQEL